ncbi:ATP-binding protein [Chitinophaga filiformis]|uniref:sensor histidine kinase n=1 Tax=Chitinophaga filiformis TaxID=104663 RepID=UPI001F3F6847|nr:ATP-binding protein [Chitinophaga filiformis]MCF6404425.1 ATP-binding protein [Chitinophaga filiformis]
MKIDYANSWLPAIAAAIEEGYFAINEQDTTIGYNKSTLAAPRISQTQTAAPDCPETARMLPLAQIAQKRAATQIESAGLPVYVQHFFTSCKLKPMIRRLWKLLSPQIAEKDAHLSLNLIVPVINDLKVYLENILFNLINNAITYTRPGVIPEISIETCKEEDNIVLMVHDNGTTIDLEKHEEQLFRYRRRFHRGYGSNGIGLFMIRDQIRTFGCNIEVTNESGMGSSFYVYFNNRVHTLQQDE